MVFAIADSRGFKITAAITLGKQISNRQSGRIYTLTPNLHRHSDGVWNTCSEDESPKASDYFFLPKSLVITSLASQNLG